MSFATLKQQLYNWFVAQTVIPGSQVIFDRQGGPRPPRPYATIKVASSDKKLGSTDDQFTDASGVTTLSGQREASVSINVFGVAGDGTSAMEILAAARNSLELPSVVDTFAQVPMAITDTSDVRDLSALEETDYQQRAQMDLTVQYTVTTVDANAGEIDSVTAIMGGVDISAGSATIQVQRGS